MLARGDDPPDRPKGHDQPTAARRDWGYSRGWRAFTVAVLLPLLRLLIRFRWQGKEYLPRR